MEIDFGKYSDGLAPAIVQDADTGIVLMLGFMNEESLQKTMDTKLVTFFSRTKNRLWTKGEKSHNFLHLIDLRTDCDKDSILIKAKPDGPVCHRGNDTCFDEKNISEDFLSKLGKIIESRKLDPSENSYVSSLFKKGINAIAQKVGEEAIELVIEAKDDDQEKFLNESADLLFHYLILLSNRNFSLLDVVKILEKRHAGSK